MYIEMILENLIRACVIFGIICVSTRLVRLVLVPTIRFKYDYWLEWSLRAACIAVLPYVLMTATPSLKEIIIQDDVMTVFFTAPIGLLMIYLALIQFYAPCSIKTVFVPNEMLIKH